MYDANQGQEDKHHALSQQSPLHLAHPSRGKKHNTATQIPAKSNKIEVTTATQMIHMFKPLARRSPRIK